MFVANRVAGARDGARLEVGGVPRRNATVMVRPEHSPNQHRSKHGQKPDQSDLPRLLTWAVECASRDGMRDDGVQSDQYCGQHAWNRVFVHDQGLQPRHLVRFTIMMPESGCRRRAAPAVAGPSAAGGIAKASATWASTDRMPARRRAGYLVFQGYGDPSLCVKRPSRLELIMSISEQVARSEGWRDPTSRYSAGPDDRFWR